MSCPALIVTLASMLLPQDGSADVLAQARAMLDEGRGEGAVQLLETALEEAGGSDRDVALLLAEAQVAVGRAQDAIETLDGIGARDDGDVALATGKAYLGWADEMSGRGAPGDDVRVAAMDGASYLERAVKAAPAGDHAARILLGNVVLYRLGEADRAYALADEVLQVEAEQGELLLLRGCAGVYRYWSAKEAGDQAAVTSAWKQASQDLQAADKLLPKERIEPLGQLAWLYEDNDLPEKAVEAACAIFDRQPEPSYDLIWRLARRYAQERNFVAAGKAMEKLVSTSAREVALRLRREDDPLAAATELSWSVGPSMERGDAATARNILASIVAIDPDSAVIWSNYAVACQMTGKFEDAVKAYERALQIDATDPRTYNDLAAVLQFDLKKDLDKAGKLYGDCIAMADTQLADPQLDPQRKSAVAEAKRIAQDNLKQLPKPKPAEGAAPAVGATATGG